MPAPIPRAEEGLVTRDVLVPMRDLGALQALAIIIGEEGVGVGDIGGEAERARLRFMSPISLRRRCFRFARRFSTSERN